MPTRPATVVSVLIAALLASVPAFGESGEYDFSLYTLEDTLYELEERRSEEETRLVAVDFFATYCKPCKTAVPEWKKLHRSYADEGLEIVIVGLAARDDREAARQSLVEFFDGREVPFPVVFDKYSRVGEQYGVVEEGSANIPQAFLLDSRGELVASGEGPDDLVSVLDERLE